MTARTLGLALALTATLVPKTATAADTKTDPARLRKSGTDTSNFDLGGVRLGMSPDEAVEAMSEKAGTRDGLKITKHQDGMRIEFYNPRAGHEVTITFGVHPETRKLRAERVILVLGPSLGLMKKPNPERAAMLEAAALKKYGPPTVSTGESRQGFYQREWCTQLINSFKDEWICDIHKAGVHLTLTPGEVEMVDPRFEEERREFARKPKADL